MASRAGELPIGRVRATPAAPSRRPPLTLAPAMLWVVGISSAALLAIYSLWYSATEPEMDDQVYRMGAQHLFGPDLYSSQIEVLGRHLSFTYPPFAALLFWPISHLSVFAGQFVWNAINLAALFALITVSIAAARSRRLASTRLPDRSASPPPCRIAPLPGTKRPGPRANKHRADPDDRRGSDDWGLLARPLLPAGPADRPGGGSQTDSARIYSVSVGVPPMASRLQRHAHLPSCDRSAIRGVPVCVVVVFHQGRLRCEACGEQPHHWKSGAPRRHHPGASYAVVGADRSH